MDEGFSEFVAHFEVSIIARGVGMYAREQVSTRWLFALLVVGQFANLGCRAKTDRLPVSGTVTLNSEPLDGGTIRFTSIGAEKLIASGAMITNGRFEIPREKGLPPGRYALEISAADPNIPAGALTAPERIPPEYNVNSQKTVEVTAGGDNHFTFEIVTKTR